MDVLLTILFAIVNIATFIVFMKEARDPRLRLSTALLFGLPLVGGSFGAILANYFFKTEHRELRSRLHKGLSYIPPIAFIAQVALAIALIGPDKTVYRLIPAIYGNAGVLGCVLFFANVLAFIFVALRKSSYFFAPYGGKFVPDVVLIPAIILGAIGATLSKVMFNFYEDWSLNVSKKLQNFLYNNGMFAVCILYVAAIFFIFK